MRAKTSQTNMPDRKAEKDGNNNLPGYPLYPAGEDIYSKDKKERRVNPEDTSKSKEPPQYDKAGIKNEKSFTDDVSGNDLDVPGSELDDEQENIGSEDEENNYYSLGGDDHNDLDEDRGD